MMVKICMRILSIYKALVFPSGLLARNQCGWWMRNGIFNCCGLIVLSKLSIISYNGLFQIMRTQPCGGRLISIEGSDLRPFNEVLRAYFYGI